MLKKNERNYQILSWWFTIDLFDFALDFFFPSTTILDVSPPTYITYVCIMSFLGEKEIMQYFHGKQKVWKSVWKIHACQDEKRASSNKNETWKFKNYFGHIIFPSF